MTSLFKDVAVVWQVNPYPDLATKNWRPLATASDRQGLQSVCVQELMFILYRWNWTCSDRNKSSIIVLGKQTSIYIPHFWPYDNTFHYPSRFPLFKWWVWLLCCRRYGSKMVQFCPGRIWTKAGCSLLKPLNYWICREIGKSTASTYDL